MAKKAKTTKELSNESNQLLIIVEELKDELKETKINLNSKIEKLQNEIKTNKLSQKIISTRKDKKERKKDKSCSKCEFTGNTNIEIKNHMIQMHPQEFECKTCEASFPRRSDLEEHISSTHEMSESFQCDKCTKKFVMKWRLQKHLEMHKTNVKFCHFYNNDKICKFERNVVNLNMRHLLSASLAKDVKENFAKTNMMSIILK